MEMQRNRWSQQVIMLFLPFIFLLFLQSLAHGGQWTSVVPPSVSTPGYLAGIHFSSDNEGWAVGEDSKNKKGVLLHYSNGSWKSVTSPTLGKTWRLNGIHFTSADEGWAVGLDNSDTLVNPAGVLLHYSGGVWTSVTPPSVSSDWWLNAVHFTSADEGWAVGYDDTNSAAVLLHYSGGIWTQYATSTGNYWQLNAVHFTSADEGWAVGVGGVLLHYSGGTWASVTPPATSNIWDLNGVHFTSAGEGWAVGVEYDIKNKNTIGVLLHYTTSDGWVAVAPPTLSKTFELTGVHFISADEGWAVGYDNKYTLVNTAGVLLHYTTSGGWESVTPPTVKSQWDLRGVHFTSQGQGWAVGGFMGLTDVLLHYDSGTRILAVSSSGAGTGAVTSSPAGINCGSTCSAEFIKGTKVALVPQPAWGSSFAGWSGDCKGKTPCKVTMSEDISVTADFSSTACVYTISPSLKTMNYKGGTVKATVKAAGSTYCAIPTPETTASWITLGSYSFSGAKGTAVLNIDTLNSSVAQTGAITIDGATLLTIKQTGKPCAITLTSGTSSDPLASGGADSSFTFDTDPADCAWSAKSGASWLTIASALSGTGGGKVDFHVDANTKSARSSKITLTTTLDKKSKNYTVRQAKP